PALQRLLDGFISQLPPFATQTAFEQHPELRHPKSGQQVAPCAPQAAHLPLVQMVKGALHLAPGQHSCCSLPHVGPGGSLVASPTVLPPVPLASGAATSRSSVP